MPGTCRWASQGLGVTCFGHLCPGRAAGPLRLFCGRVYLVTCVRDVPLGPSGCLGSWVPGDLGQGLAVGPCGSRVLPPRWLLRRVLGGPVVGLWPVGALTRSPPSTDRRHLGTFPLSAWSRPAPPVSLSLLYSTWAAQDPCRLLRRLRCRFPAVGRRGCLVQLRRLRGPCLRCSALLVPTVRLAPPCSLAGFSPSTPGSGARRGPPGSSGVVCWGCRRRAEPGSGRLNHPARSVGVLARSAWVVSAGCLALGAVPRLLSADWWGRPARSVRASRRAPWGALGLAEGTRRMPRWRWRVPGGAGQCSHCGAAPWLFFARWPLGRVLTALLLGLRGTSCRRLMRFDNECSALFVRFARPTRRAVPCRVCVAALAARALLTALCGTARAGAPLCL